MKTARRIPDASDRTHIDFLDNELDLCNTFLNLAEIDQDDPVVAGQARENAQRAYETLLSWIGAVKNTAELDRLTSELALLKQRIENSPL